MARADRARRRGQRLGAGARDAPLEAADDARTRVTLEFVGDRVARMVLSTTEVIPERHIIELQDHTIDIEVEVFSSIMSFFLEDFYDSVEIDTMNLEKSIKINSFESPRCYTMHHRVI